VASLPWFRWGREARLMRINPGSSFCGKRMQGKGDCSRGLRLRGDKQGGKVRSLCSGLKRIKSREEKVLVNQGARGGASKRVEISGDIAERGLKERGVKTKG